MSSTEPGEEWRRLGDLLLARRVQLGWPSRVAFAREHGLSHDRTISDLENARRTNYGAATYPQMEQIYRWGPGSIRRVLEGGEPHPLPREHHDGSSPVVQVYRPAEPHVLPGKASPSTEAAGSRTSEFAEVGGAVGREAHGRPHSRPGSSALPVGGASDAPPVTDNEVLDFIGEMREKLNEMDDMRRRLNDMERRVRRNIERGSGQGGGDR